MTMLKHLIGKPLLGYFTKPLRTSTRLASYATLDKCDDFETMESTATRKLPVVNSHNEWDPLEEVIVGTARGAHVPPFDFAAKAHAAPSKWALLEQAGGKPFPTELVEAANKELDNFAHILEQEGITVRRPEVFDGDVAKSFKTPDFESPCGLYATMPRDVLLVIGDTIVEAPMSWRCRFFEYRHYRKLIKEYFKAGAKWVTAPKATMSDQMYDKSWKLEEATLPENPNGYHTEYKFCLTEFEPMFEAPDFARCGRDIFYELSHATNQFGVEWLKRTFPEYRFHRVSMANAPQALHMDCMFVPLGPGKLLIQGEKPPRCGGPSGVGGWFQFDGKPSQYRLPAIFKGWDVFVAPNPQFSKQLPYFCSQWVASSNVLMLDPERVVVEANEPEVIKSFQRWGFKPIPVSIRNTLRFGGGFHCITCDVRRRGELKSYF